MNDGIKLDIAEQAGPLAWPSDAIMIVAAIAGTENRPAMQAIYHFLCRRCRRTVAADKRTIDTALDLAERGTRPIDFFCPDCAILHDRGQLDLLVDQRNGNNTYMRKGKP